MQRQNITLSIPKDTLKKVKHLAIERQTSISGLLAKTFEEIITKDEAYTKAKSRQLAMMQEGFDLGLKGNINCQREELYDRE